MSDRQKKIFLLICIITPFLLYCFYYYGIMIKNAPYKFSEFESIKLKYGLGDKLVNQYDSKTGDYQYLNERDSLIKTKVKLSKDELLYLHRKAAEQGFWDFPEVFYNPGERDKKSNSVHYYIEYNYDRKSKHVLFDSDYRDNQKLGDAARQLIKEITNVINDAQDKGK